MGKLSIIDGRKKLLHSDIEWSVYESASGHLFAKARILVEGRGLAITTATIGDETRVFRRCVQAQNQLMMFAFEPFKTMEFECEPLWGYHVLIRASLPGAFYVATRLCVDDFRDAFMRAYELQREVAGALLRIPF